MSRANESNEFSLPAIFLMYFTYTLIQFEIISWHSFYGQEMTLSTRDCSLDRSHVRTRAYCTCDKTKRMGMARECPVGDLVSSFAYANRGIRTGHVALHIRSGGERERGGGFFAPWERVIVVSSRYCRRNTSEQSTILLEIRRVFVSARMNKCQSLPAFSCRFLPVTPIKFSTYI